jgi:hypothetical protein
VQWTDNSTNEDGFEIHVTSSASSSWSITDITPGDVSTGSETWTQSVVDGIYYCYRVRAYRVLSGVGTRVYSDYADGVSVCTGCSMPTTSASAINIVDATSYEFGTWTGYQERWAALMLHVHQIPPV